MLNATETAPYRKRTFRQPPSHGESTVALSMAPMVNPRDIPVAITPLAIPIRCLENHILLTLGMFAISIALRMPYKNDVAAKLIKPLDNPRRAPAMPTEKQVKIMMRFSPKRSPNIPPMRNIGRPAKKTIPQIVPTWTRFKPNSSNISLNKTGMHISGAA
jgi:hypothetical protein